MSETNDENLHFLAIKELKETIARLEESLLEKEKVVDALQPGRTAGSM